MRQYAPFPPEPPLADPNPPLSLARALKQRLARFYTHFRPAFLVAAVIIIALGTVRVYSMTQPAPQRLTQRDIDAAVQKALASIPPGPSNASLAYAAILPSVVFIQSTLPEKDGKPGKALGTGVIINDRGSILTCLHVVNGASALRITFADGSHSDATISMEQPENDLAVLEPAEIPDDLFPAVLGSSSGLNVGDEVFTVGNPFGIAFSLSAGVVSGLDRTFKAQKTGETLNDLIQFDAAVNPGNSGGPLVNRDGEVVGIVTALLNPTDQDVFIGIGFAIPIETAGAAGGAPPI